MKKRAKLSGTWKEVKEKLKQQYAQLTDNDILFTEDKKDELISALQIRLGKTKEEIEKIISSL